MVKCAENTVPETATSWQFGFGANDLLVVGAGGLGRRAARQWLERYPDARVTCATWSDAQHESLAAEGFAPVLSSSSLPCSPHVLFCAPPSARQETPAYCADVRRAAACATRRFVFTSATSVYADNGIVREDSPLALTPRARRMRAAEAAAFMGASPAVSVGIVRMALLYDRTRGAHAAFLGAGESYHGSGSMYNVIHYDDAAGAALATLRAEPEAGTFFIASDGSPITSGQMVHIAMRHPTFMNVPPPTWGIGEYSKILDATHTYEALDWQPKWKNFAQFFESDAKLLGSDFVLSGSE